MKFFHIDSGDPYAGRKLLQVGQEINTESREFNPFYSKVCDLNAKFDSCTKRSRRVLEFLDNDAHLYQVPQLTRAFHTIAEEYIRLVREMEFENIRKNHFSNLPSRTRCIWLSDSLESARYWRKRVAKDGQTQILRVQAEGKIFRTDGRHLAYDSHTITELRDAANLYWSGSVHANPEPEILFEGKLTVLKVEEA